MKKKSKILDRILKYYRSIQAIMILIVVFVLFSFINVPKKEKPELIFKQGIIIGLYPGANSVEVEEHLTSKVGSFNFCYNDIDKLKTFSHSKDGMMIIHVELADNVKHETRFWMKMENELANHSLQ